MVSQYEVVELLRRKGDMRRMQIKKILGWCDPQIVKLLERGWVSQYLFIDIKVGNRIVRKKVPQFLNQKPKRLKTWIGLTDNARNYLKSHNVKSFLETPGAKRTMILYMKRDKWLL